ncbi:MAG: slipin family protein [Planctomycetota bacterium]
MMRTLHIRKHEFGLLFKDGDLERVLGPGKHRLLPAVLSKTKVDRVSTLGLVFEHPMLETLIDEPALKPLIEVVDLKDHERAIVWKDGRLVSVLAAGRHAFFKRPGNFVVEIYDAKETPLLEHASLSTIVNAALPLFLPIEVPDGHCGIAVVDGEPIERLEPGRHAFFKGTATIHSRLVDLRSQQFDVSGQEIMTKDKVTLRINLLVAFRVVDPFRAVSVTADVKDALYRSAQLALREAVGVRTLDQLLTEKDGVTNDMRNDLVRESEALGVEIDRVGIRDVILPGDMKMILNQVIEAQKFSEANVIRRREETAAARSQANTAKLLAENPALMRLRELEALQEILKGANATFVLGSGDVSDQIRSIVAGWHSS